jgi:threonine synthase
MSSRSKYFLQCAWCKKNFKSDAKIRSCSNCSGSLEIIYDYEKLKNTYKGIPTTQNAEIGIWKYAPLLPMNENTLVVTLGEGGTPYHQIGKAAAQLGIRHLFVKDESRNPTCSFKDRKSTCSITKAVEEGFKRVVAATAGNAGSSVAAYSAKADIESYILAFQGISQTKLAKLLAYNANVFLTKASTGDVLEFVDQVCKQYGLLNCSAASRYNPYVKEGAKTALFEIYEQTNGELPDWIILPLGGGGNIAAYYKGLQELEQLGLLKNSPKLVGVQGTGCAPVVEAFEKKLDARKIPKVENPRTIAHSILDDWAPDGDVALVAIRETNGLAVGVNDEQIIEAMKVLSGKEAMYVEPSSAAPLAALKKLLANKTIDRNEPVATIITGFGLNQPEATMSAYKAPNSLASLDVLEFGKFINQE